MGDILKAKVVSVKTFGAFVSLPGYRAQGLVHISQLAPRRVEAVEDVVNEGDEVWVKVLSAERGRISLSMRVVDQADGSERDDAGGDSRGGGRRDRDDGGPLPELYSIHRGQVMKVESFGAFISLSGFKKQGLLHISQISNQRIEAEDIPSIISVGEDIFVKVCCALPLRPRPRPTTHPAHPQGHHHLCATASAREPQPSLPTVRHCRLFRSTRWRGSSPSP